MDAAPPLTEDSLPLPAAGSDSASGSGSRTAAPGDFEQRLAHARPALLGAAQAVTGSQHGDAEDLVHETLARALERRASFDHARPLMPWLRRMLLRLRIDQLRQAARRREAHARQAAEPRGAAAPEHFAQEQTQLLLAALDEPGRTILRRFHQDGESIEALGRALGMPTGTIKSHLHRARMHLAARFTLGPGATVERRSEDQP